MSDQLSFAGFDKPTPPSDALFFAILPDPDAAAQVTRVAQGLCAEHGLKGRPLAPDRFHITLSSLGTYAGLPRNVVAAARDAAATVAIPPFEVAFDRAMSFFGNESNRPLVLLGGDGVAGLEMFQQTLVMAMTKAGLGRWAGSRYMPHLTLLYDGRPVAEQAIETVRWTVSEFVLIHSMVGQTRHVPLARWPLRR